MKPSQIAAFAVAVLASAGMAQAQPSATQVRSWAAACAACHGTNGHSGTGRDSLAGTNKDDLLKKLLDYKSGAKPAIVMHQLAKGYTDEQLAAISAWFAAQQK